MNETVARMLHELAELTELKEGSAQAFRVRAYENAARAVENLDRDVSEMTEKELVAVKGIGESIASKIREFVETGHIAKLDELRAEYPPEFVELLHVPGLGPKRVQALRDELGVQSVEGLRHAIEAGALRDLPGFGEKTEQNLAKAIERLGMSGKEVRRPIADVLPVATAIVEGLEGLGKAAVYAGSLRRFRETIGDVDVLVAAADHRPVVERFATLPDIAEVRAGGETKVTASTSTGLQVDLRVVDPDQFGAALAYFTGSKAHNIRMRQLAIDRGWMLNEYGLFDGDRVVAAKTEQDIYEALGLEFVPPPMREDTGEIERAARHDLPTVVELEDLRGDLHVHTDWSGDGRATLEEMLHGAKERGYAYVAITDHGKNLRVNGLSEERMLEQRAEIEKLRERFAPMVILHGSELNIGTDGSLDYDDDFLAGFDWCVAGVHDHFDLPKEQQTERLIAAMRHPAVRAIAHPFGRIIGRRPPIELDVEAVLAAAVETRTALEINSHLQRLDLPAEVARRAVNEGVRIIISSDAHAVHELGNVGYGVQHAQRGWVPKQAVLNAQAGPPSERSERWGEGTAAP